MSDQQPPANPQDTAAVAGPIEAPGAAQEQPQEVNWQDRYNHLQPEYTRTTQQLKELEQKQQWYELLVTSDDPDTRRQAAEVLGYELPDDTPEEPEPAYEDPYDELRAEVLSVRERQEQAERAAQEAQEGALIRTLVDERLGQIDGLSPEDHDLVLAYAINALPPVREPGVPVPLPDVRAAAEFFVARETERQKQWAKSKRAPYVPPGGVTANEVPDTSTHDGRVSNMMRRLQEMEQQD